MNGLALAIRMLYFSAVFVGGTVKGDELTDAINVERAKYGLQPLTYELSLSAWAKLNNEAEERNHLLGHFVRPEGQVCLITEPCGSAGLTAAGAVQEWIATDHRQRDFMRPEARFGGGAISADRKWWTYNVSCKVKPVAPANLPDGLGEAVTGLNAAACSNAPPCQVMMAVPCRVERRGFLRRFFGGCR